MNSVSTIWGSSCRGVLFFTFPFFLGPTVFDTTGHMHVRQTRWEDLDSEEFLALESRHGGEYDEDAYLRTTSW